MHVLRCDGQSDIDILYIVLFIGFWELIFVILSFFFFLMGLALAIAFVNTVYCYL